MVNEQAVDTRKLTLNRELALNAVKLAVDKKVLDPLLLNVGKITYLADYFFICTGSSVQHVQALADNIKEGLKKHGYNLTRIEGYREGKWILMDYGDMVVHIFTSGEREFYNLERLWTEADKVDLLAEKIIDPQYYE